MRLFNGLILLVLFSSYVYGDIVITELMANPLEDESLNEYIEIYNNASEAVNISGWVIGDNRDNDTIEGGSYGGSGTIISSFGYGIITDEMTRVYNNFNVSEDTIKLYIDDASIGYGGLGNAGDSVYLYDNNMNLVDSFNYSSTTEGLSWTRVGNNWIEDEPTPGNNGTVDAAVIEENLCNWQIKIILDKSFYINSSLVEWKIEVYRLEGDKTNLSVEGYVKKVNGDIVKEYNPWTNTSITLEKTKSYSPNLEENTVYLLEYNITYLSCNDTDLSNNYFSSLIAVGLQLPESEDEQNISYDVLRISEFLPNPEGDDTEGEWLELYNSGSFDLNLKGLELKDDSSRNIIIADVNTESNTTISAEGYKVVYTGGVYGFLNNDGFEEISLYYGDSLIDAVSYSSSTEGNSWSLSGTSWNLSMPTPGVANAENNSGKDSIFNIEKIYDLGSYNRAKFGQTIRAKVNIWKGDDTKNSISLWVEDEKGHRISKHSKASIYTKYTSHDLALPVQIYPNCDENYEDGNYTLKIGWTSGYKVKDSYNFSIRGISNDVCVGKEKPKEEKAKRFVYELVSAPDKILAGKEFKAEVKLVNNENRLHNITIWSYVYRGPKCYSGIREENKKELILPRNGEVIETLKNKVKEAEPGDYKLRIMIIKDVQKTPYIITGDISIVSPDENNESKLSIGKLDEKTGLLMIDVPEDNEAALQSKKVPRIVYESTSAASSKLIPYFMIFISLVLNVILILKR
tara:strand:+ start:13062 stop:15287 length:2226 start_codon:yes stop_codon:yes gene_type:complete